MIFYSIAGTKKDKNMIRHFLKLGFRNLKKNLSNTLVHIFSLSLGIAILLVISIFVKNEFCNYKTGIRYCKPKEKQEIMLIDVRKEADFERCRIPGSLNIPLHTLKTKAFLKSKPLALINKGYNSGTLEKKCLRLMEAGFTDVSFVIGGLYKYV